MIRVAAAGFRVPTLKVAPKAEPSMTAADKTKYAVAGTAAILLVGAAAIILTRRQGFTPNSFKDEDITNSDMAFSHVVAGALASGASPKDAMSKAIETFSHMSDDGHVQARW